VVPLVFQSSCNTEVVDTYFEKVLLLALPPHIVIVLDNARFHQSPRTLRLAETASCHLLFLPPYWSDFNPIKHLWAAF
jgi:transposase